MQMVSHARLGAAIDSGSPCLACCQPDLFNPLKTQLAWVKPADDWTGLKTAMTPLQYKTFYILAKDGSTPAAKVVVLGGQQDKINANKLSVSVDEGHKIIGYDAETRSDAFEDCLTKGISAKIVTKFLVPKVCFHVHKPKLAGCPWIDLTFVLLSCVCVCSVQEMCHRSRDSGLWTG
jgi:hypothetical protein